MPIFPNYIPLLVLSAVFILICVRQVAGVRLAIWQIMAGGALIVLATGAISPKDAFDAIDFEVIFFLFGMFVVGEALIESGYLYHVSHDIFKSGTSVDRLVLLVLFVFGLFSSFLMNDTVAIIGTPLVLYFAERHGISKKLMLLALCFAVTIGSVASPIGNPQNLLIAVNAKVAGPFQTFIYYLGVPTALNLLITFSLLKLFFREHFHEQRLDNQRDDVRDRHLAGLARWAVMLIFGMITLKVAGVFLGFDFPLTLISAVACLPVLALSPRRFHILKRIDWHTLVFFAAMFVLMGSVWRTGVVQAAVNGCSGDISSTGVIMTASVVLSQALSNVPFVALYMPVLIDAGVTTKGLMALAAGSTIAGNLLILGAASNVIIIQNAEKRRETLGFFEFARVGVPLTVLNAIVYWGYLSLLE